MQRATQITVCLPNKPGMLAMMCRCLAEARVNILAISVVDASEACLVRVVPDDAKAATKALDAKGIQTVQTSVRLVELPNKVGALAEMAERLAQRKVNIAFAYGSAEPGRGKAVLVMEARAAR